MLIKNLVIFKFSESEVFMRDTTLFGQEDWKSRHSAKAFGFTYQIIFCSFTQKNWNKKIGFSEKKKNQDFSFVRYHLAVTFPTFKNTALENISTYMPPMVTVAQVRSEKAGVPSAGPVAARM